MEGGHSDVSMHETSSRQLRPLRRHSLLHRKATSLCKIIAALYVDARQDTHDNCEFGLAMSKLARPLPSPRTASVGISIALAHARNAFKPSLAIDPAAATGA